MTDAAFDVDSLTEKEALDALRVLAERFDVGIQARKPLADWAKAVASGHASENQDGVVVLRLRAPIQYDGESVSRVTMRRVKVRHMRAAESGLETDVMRLTASLCDPPVFDDLESDDDASTFVAAGVRQLGKFRGVPPTTSVGTSAASEVTSASPRLI